tara:strand:+ start:114 stop:395 length:282 start_codon:yes stop_codon:yes gene_type:complete
MSKTAKKTKFHVAVYPSIATLIEYHSCDTLCEVDGCSSYTFSEAKEHVADFYKDEVEYYKNKLFHSEHSVEYWSTVSLEDWKKYGMSINDYEI